MSALRRLVDQLFKRDGLRGPVLTLVSGTTLTMALSYAALPILTRLYDAEAWGVYDYVVMLLSVLMTAASLRYEDALMTPEDDAEAAGVLGLALVLSCATCALLVVAALFAGDIAALLGVPEVAPWLWLLAPALLLMRLVRLAEYWATRRKQFRRLAAADAAGKAASIVVKVGAGLLPAAGPGGLMAGLVAGSATSTAIYGRLLWGARGLRDALAPRLLWRLARRFRRFPLYSTPASVLNALMSRLPVLLLPVFFGLATVGHFGRAFVALAVPLTLVGAAVAQVFFIHAAEAYRAGTLATATTKVYARLVQLGLFPTLALMVAAPDLFEVVFGEAWRVAGVYERVLAPWFFLTALTSPLTRLFDVLERQRTDLTLSAVMFVLQSAALWLGGRTGDVLLTMAYVGTAGAAARLLHLVVLLRLGGVSLVEAIRPFGRYGLFSAAPLALLAAAQAMETPALTLGAGVVAGLAYLGLNVWRDRLL